MKNLSHYHSNTLNATFRLRQVNKKWKRDIESSCPLNLRILPHSRIQPLLAAIRQCHNIQRLVVVHDPEYPIDNTLELISPVLRPENCNLELRYFELDEDKFNELYHKMAGQLKLFKGVEYHIEGNVDIKDFPISRNTTCLHFEGNINIEEFSLVDNENNLKRVDLCSYGIVGPIESWGPNGFLSTCPKLKALDIASECIGHPYLSSPLVERLLIEGDLISGADFSRTLNGCPKLKELVVEVVDEIGELQQLESLETLKLQGSIPSLLSLLGKCRQLKSLTISFFDRLAKVGEFPFVEDLTIDACKVDVEQKQNFIASFPTLKKLTIENSYDVPMISSSTLKQLKLCSEAKDDCNVNQILENCPALEELILDDCSTIEVMKIGSLRHLELSRVKSLKHLEMECSHLKTLVISSCENLRAASVAQVVAKSKSLSKLGIMGDLDTSNEQEFELKSESLKSIEFTTLDFSTGNLNFVSDGSVGYMLKHCTNLEHVGIRGGQLIQPKLQSSSLQRLWIDLSKHLSEIALSSIDCPQLECLEVRNCPKFSSFTVRSKSLQLISIVNCRNLQREDFTSALCCIGNSLRRVYTDLLPEADKRWTGDMCQGDLKCSYDFVINNVLAFERRRNSIDAYSCY